jgi:protein-disulfide isomerase/uncharacterized membrane protein
LHFEAISDPAHQSYCSVNETVSCDAVARSEYAVAFGVPLAVWGVFGYAVMAMIAALGLRWRSRVPAALLATLIGFSVAVTVALAAISHFVIHAWCLVCIGTYVVNLAVAPLAFLIIGKEGVRASYRALLEQFARERARTLAVVGGAAGAVLTLILLHPPVQTSPVLVPPRTDASAASSASSSQAIPPLKPRTRIERGVTAEGSPWIGATNPVVTITEFFDYECSHCRLAFRAMHELLAVNPDRLRLVVRHFPLDQACNRSISRPIYRHSCRFAKLANCAGEQQLFWEAHEYLFEHSRENVDATTFATELSLNSKELEACLKRDNQALARDIEAGIALDLHGTPVFVVDGKVHIQRLPRSLATQLRSPAGWR